MGDKKMLTTICLMLLLWQIPQPSSAIKIEAKVVCSLRNTVTDPTVTPIYELTMGISIDDVDYKVNKKLSTQHLYPVDVLTDPANHKIVTDSAVCANKIWPTNTDKQDFDLTDLDRQFTVPDVTAAAPLLYTTGANCDEVFDGAFSHTVTVAAVWDEALATSDDTIIHYTCNCDPTADPQTCIGVTTTKAAHTPTVPTPIVITATATGTVLSLLIYDCNTDLEVPAGPVAVDTCVYLVLKYEFPEDSDAINIYPYSCMAYPSDPNAIVTALMVDYIMDILDDDGCPFPGSQVMQPSHGLISSLGKGETGSSPIIWFSGKFNLMKFRDSDEVWFKCTAKYCRENTDSTCFGKTDQNRCNDKKNDRGLGFARKRRAVPGGKNNTENLVTALHIVYPWELPAGTLDQTSNGQTGGDSCFQNASFLAIVVVLLLLLLIALCVSLVLCYKLRNRQHYNEKRVVEHCHVKHGMDNPNMSI